MYSNRETAEQFAARVYELTRIGTIVGMLGLGAAAFVMAAAVWSSGHRLLGQSIAVCSILGTPLCIHVTLRIWRKVLDIK